MDIIWNHAMGMVSGNVFILNWNLYGVGYKEGHHHCHGLPRGFLFYGLHV